MTDLSYHVWEAIFGCFQMLAITIGAVWAWRRLNKERTHTPHIEFDIVCNFYGPELGHYLAEFILSADNRGYVIHRFPSIKLRVRGIRANTELQFWPGNEPRLLFPASLLDDVEVVFREKYSHIFVEPGVKQNISFVTKFPESFKYIVARAQFNYDDDHSHSIERVLPVSATKSQP
jgi:hypothetical protein